MHNLARRWRDGHARPGQDGDDSDHGIDTWSDQKRRKCSMPEPTCTGVDPGNCGLIPEHVQGICGGTGDGPNSGIARHRKNPRHVTIANQAKKQQRTMDRLDHRIPWGHAHAHMNPRELTCLMEGMLPRWFDAAHAMKEAHQKFVELDWMDWPTSDQMNQARQRMKDILKPWGIDKWRCIEKFDSDKQFPHMPLWTGGKCWNDFHGDARPDMPHTSGPMAMECDLYLTDYDPSFWTHCFPAWCHRSASSQDGMGVDTGHGSTWLTWRGTHPYEAITAIAGNLLMKQEKENDLPNCLECDFPFEKGVATTQSWEMAVRGAIPIIHEGVEVQTKMVLLAMAPGDSQQELGTMFRLKHRDPTGRDPKLQKYKLLDKWQVIPTKPFEKEMLQLLPVAAVQEGVFRHMRMECMEFRPPSLVQRVEDLEFEPFPHLMQRTSTEDMQEKAHAGHPSEGAWTNTDSDGLRITSSMLHIVGVAVLYYGMAGYTRYSNAHTKHKMIDKFDMLKVPPWARPSQAPTKHEDS